ncbi:MAG: cytochrome c biogenesis heme-transporting ATPase CcmA [Gammaproteobacteria bacterium]|nr:MAG: cytochrome c biogenesis heme-transporting ATPase CcmA [Gammaproteobacteria bacterium]
MSDTLLEVRTLRCERDFRVLFKDLSFTVNAGDVVQVEGPNGSGKTTLLRMLAGLLPVHEGEVFWRGEPMQRVRPMFYEELLYLGHKTGVKDSLTAFENLRSWAALRAPVSDDRLLEALERVGLKGFEHSLAHNLSAGQQRRIALARLFVSDAPFWILDEPFTAIDKKGVAELENLMIQRGREGMAVLMTTHHAPRIEGELKKVTLGRVAA